uniref:Uncharacterized protein n=1 Tax=Arundo donax TaxID=35708 RepID=A0A0A8YLJ0_ARUDO
MIDSTQMKSQLRISYYVCYISLKKCIIEN